MTDIICRRKKNSIGIDRVTHTETWCGRMASIPSTAGHWRNSSCSACERAYNEWLMACHIAKANRAKKLTPSKK